MAKERIAQDFYPTPIWCIDALLAHLTPKEGDVFLEPAMGDGRIFDRFPAGYDKKWAELSAHRDYLNPMGYDYSADVIITNPPFSNAMDFIRYAIDRDMKKDGTVCMLLRMSILGSKERADFWREFPFTNLFTLTPRPQFVHGGSDNSEYAWFVWDYGQRFDLTTLWTFKREEHDLEYKNNLLERENAKVLTQIKARLKAENPSLKGKALLAAAEAELYTEAV
ncbi:DNA methyltransferase [Vibrio fluvialis]